MNLYEVLESKRDDALPAIRRRYLKLVKKHHPDKGGDAEKFRAIQHAFDVISDPVRRKRYDETGDDKIHAEEPWEPVLMGIFEECLDKGQMGDDLIAQARNKVTSRKRKIEEELEKTRKDAANLRKLLDQFTGPEKNLMRLAIEKRINIAEGAIPGIVGEIEIGARILQELEHYRHNIHWPQSKNGRAPTLIDVYLAHPVTSRGPFSFE